VVPFECKNAVFRDQREKLQNFFCLVNSNAMIALLQQLKSFQLMPTALDRLSSVSRNFNQQRFMRLQIEKLFKVVKTKSA